MKTVKTVNVLEHDDAGRILRFESIEEPIQPEESTIVHKKDHALVGPATVTRMSNDDLVEAIFRDIDKIEDELFNKMQEAATAPGSDVAFRYNRGTHLAIKAGFREVLIALAHNRFHAVRAREALEDRVIALEAAQPKPRHRVKAPSRPQEVEP